jgi:hypothetical protein
MRSVFAVVILLSASSFAFAQQPKPDQVDQQRRMGESREILLNSIRQLVDQNSQLQATLKFDQDKIDELKRQNEALEKNAAEALKAALAK